MARKKLETVKEPVKVKKATKAEKAQSKPVDGNSQDIKEQLEKLTNSEDIKEQLEKFTNSEKFKKFEEQNMDAFLMDKTLKLQEIKSVILRQVYELKQIQVDCLRLTASNILGIQSGKYSEEKHEKVNAICKIAEDWASSLKEFAYINLLLGETK